MTVSFSLSFLLQLRIVPGGGVPKGGVTHRARSEAARVASERRGVPGSGCLSGSELPVGGPTHRREGLWVWLCVPRTPRLCLYSFHMHDASFLKARFTSGFWFHLRPQDPMFLGNPQRVLQVIMNSGKEPTLKKEYQKLYALRNRTGANWSERKEGYQTRNHCSCKDRDESFWLQRGSTQASLLKTKTTWGECNQFYTGAIGLLLWLTRCDLYAIGKNKFNLSIELRAPRESINSRSRNCRMLPAPSRDR